MPAIITTDFKKQIIQDFYDDITDSAERYFIGIGRSEDWDSSDLPPTPVNTFREIRNARLSLQSIKSSEDVSFVVPRTNWISGTIYNAWNDDQVNYPTPNYFVITSSNSVYMVISCGKSASGAIVSSTIEPTGSSTAPFSTADGYTWKFLYTITALNASKFLTANYFPVRLIESVDSSSSALDIEQYNVQVAAIPGQISSIKITSPGAGYITAPAVTIRGNGTGAAATASLLFGQVVNIDMNNDSSALGSGYSYAEIILTGGGYSIIATALPNIGVANGFGADPRDDLKSTAIMLNMKSSGTEGGDFITGNNFRQIVLMKDVLKNNDSDFIAGTGNVLKTLVLSTVNVNFTVDRIVSGVTSGARAIVDNFSGSTIYFHQNETTGFGLFTEGETINEVNGPGNGVLALVGSDSDSLAETEAEVNLLSGKILYIDNRAPVDRSVDQTEDIKIVIAI